MTIKELNNLGKSNLKKSLHKCCGSIAWVNKMLEQAPFSTETELYQKAETTWFSLKEKDWREAFDHHPKIGDKELEKKFADTAQWAKNEQAAVAHTSQQVLEDLKKSNQQYEEKFGFIFIVCATGKSAEEMLSLLKTRLQNNAETEIKTAAAEQNKITLLRLKKLIEKD